ncbi:MAG: NAD(P)/FAD-dependent oxidoreductase [Chlamydiota bacterium]
MDNEIYDVVIIGGGAAGFFAATQCAHLSPHKKILLLEQAPKPLAKLKISGGGRCNLTNACFDPKALVQNYPRGHKELRGAFSRFQPQDTIRWFESCGVELKTEDEGRVFPANDNSQTIIECLVGEAKKLGVSLKCNTQVKSLVLEDKSFKITLSCGKTLQAFKVMLATGDSRRGYQLAQSLGHHIFPLLPSLFTLKIKNHPLKDLAGTSIERAIISLPSAKIKQEGPIMITHWGLGGPAVLKLSAWGAQHLAKLGYQTNCSIDWLPSISEKMLRQNITRKNSKRSILNDPIIATLPKKLWAALLSRAQIDLSKRWQEISSQSKEAVLNTIKRDSYYIDGKSTFKQEFVTCGGVDLAEVDLKTCQSKKVPNLHFGGEILNIDGITGGFNFQAAWTTGYLAGQSLAI